MEINGDSCEKYLLASPSGNNSSSVLCINYYGQVNNYSYGSLNMGLRPVVSLNSGIKVNATEAE